MAHFAKLDRNNVVETVLVVNNEDCLNEAGEESESVGVEFLRKIFGYDTNWKQTSYHANIRKHYAGIGYTYDQNLDAFVPPKPFPSFVLDETTCLWKAPVEKPNGHYKWDEPSLSWVQKDPSEIVM